MKKYVLILTTLFYFPFGYSQNANFCANASTIDSFLATQQAFKASMSIGNESPLHFF